MPMERLQPLSPRAAGSQLRSTLSSAATWPAVAPTAAVAVAMTMLHTSLLHVDLLIDAFQIVALIVEFLLRRVGEYLVGLADALEHLLGRLFGDIVEVSLLVGMPLPSSLTISLLDLDLRGHRGHFEQLVIVGALMFPQGKLRLLELVMDSLLPVPLEQALELFDGILVPLEALQRLRSEEVGLHQPMVPVGRLAHVLDDGTPVLEPQAAERPVAIAARQHGRVVASSLDHAFQDLLRALELAIVEGLLQLGMFAAEQSEPLPQGLRTGVVRVEGEGLLQEPLSLLHRLGPLPSLHARVIVAIQRLGAQDECLYAARVGPEDLLRRVQHARVVFQLKVTTPHLQRQRWAGEERLGFQLRKEAEGLGRLAAFQSSVSLLHLLLPAIYLPAHVRERIQGRLAFGTSGLRDGLALGKRLSR
mmetsp:Transcript_63274/g.162802  ORF Transcript_63274/g.162802 Transcript_63274/m.162802 type:complete len:418 (+) Transcript_63274:34-1287(+)